MGTPTVIELAVIQVLQLRISCDLTPGHVQIEKEHGVTGIGNSRVAAVYLRTVHPNFS